MNYKYMLVALGLTMVSQAFCIEDGQTKVQNFKDDADRIFNQLKENESQPISSIARDVVTATTSAVETFKIKIPGFVKKSTAAVETTVKSFISKLIKYDATLTEKANQLKSNDAKKPLWNHQGYINMLIKRSETFINEIKG